MATSNVQNEIKMLSENLVKMVTAKLESEILESLLPGIKNTIKEEVARITFDSIKMWENQMEFRTELGVRITVDGEEKKC